MTADMWALYRYLSQVAGKHLGGRLVLTSTDRTCDRQLQLSGETSYHLNGHAFDAVIMPFGKNSQQQETLGRIAEYYRFRWGGRFRTRDPVHFDDGYFNRPGTCRP